MKRAYTIAVLSVIGGVVLHLMVLMVIRIEGPRTERSFQKSTRVEYVGRINQGTNPAIREQALLNDSAPLFMPTRWNLASQMADVASLKEATEIFQPYPPRIRLADSRPVTPFDIPETSQSVGGIRFPSGPGFILARYGRKEMQPPDWNASGPTAAIERLDAPVSDRVLADFPISSSLIEASPSSLWTPSQFFLHLKNGLPVGLPLVGQSSGFAEWDNQLQRYFSSLEFYRELADGYYRIRVFP